MYAAAIDAAEKEPKTAVCSPSLLGTSGVCTLSVVSIIPDIMQHYHNVIVTAQKEVLIATNAWEPGKSVELVTTALQELNDRAARDGRRVSLSDNHVDSGRGQSTHGRRQYPQCRSISI
jgi:hypothetical protein